MSIELIPSLERESAVDEEEVGALEVAVQQRLRLQPVQVLHAEGALQGPADGVAAVVGHLRLQGVQH